MADKITTFINARNAAIEAVEAAIPLMKAAEAAVEAAEAAGRDAGIKVSTIKEGLPTFSYRAELPHQGEG